MIKKSNPNLVINNSEETLKKINMINSNSLFNERIRDQNVVFLDLSNAMTNFVLIPKYFKQSMILNDNIIDEELIERLILHNTIDNEQEILSKPKLISTISK